MRRLLLLLIPIAFGLSLTVKAQSIGSNIMVANVTWQSNTATVNVYLTDTLGMTGIAIKVGNQPDSAFIDSVSYTTGSGGNFYSNGTAHDNVFQTGIGPLPSGSTYYFTVDILLANGKKNEIEISSGN